MSSAFVIYGGVAESIDTDKQKAILQAYGVTMGDNVEGADTKETFMLFLPKIKKNAHLIRTIMIDNYRDFGYASEEDTHDNLKTLTSILIDHKNVYDLFIQEQKKLEQAFSPERASVHSTPWAPLAVRGQRHQPYPTANHPRQLVLVNENNKNQIELGKLALPKNFDKDKHVTVYYNKSKGFPFIMDYRAQVRVSTLTHIMTLHGRKMRISDFLKIKEVQDMLK